MLKQTLTWGGFIVQCARQYGDDMYTRKIFLKWQMQLHFLWAACGDAVAARSRPLHVSVAAEHGLSNPIPLYVLYQLS
jgi:hypothetical protein